MGDRDQRIPMPVEEGGSMNDRVDPDAVCYCGWDGLDDTGCACVHPELRDEEE